MRQTMTKREYLLKKLKQVKNKDDNELTKRVVTKEERKVDDKCDMARLVFDEALDSYEDGTMDWQDMVEDLHSTLKAMGGMEEKLDY